MEKSLTAGSMVFKPTPSVNLEVKIIIHAMRMIPDPWVADQRNLVVSSPKLSPTLIELLGPTSTAFLTLINCTQTAKPGQELRSSSNITTIARKALETAGLTHQPMIMLLAQPEPRNL